MAVTELLAKLPKEQVTVISTAHITRGDSKSFDEAPDQDMDGGWLLVEKHQYGYWCCVPRDDASFEEYVENLRKLGYSAAFRGLLRMAKDQGINWVNLDGDGYVIEGLPTFEW